VEIGRWKGSRVALDAIDGDREESARREQHEKLANFRNLALTYLD
jgi:hypothetical protein